MLEDRKSPHASTHYDLTSNVDWLSQKSCFSERKALDELQPSYYGDNN